MLTFRLLVVLGVSCLLGLTAAQVPPQCGVSRFDRLVTRVQGILLRIQGY